MEIYGQEENYKKKMRRKAKSKFDKYFLLDFKKFLIIIVIGFVSVILHNAVYALFGIEEAIFFITAVILIPLYLIISVIYTLIKKFLVDAKKT